MNDWILLNTLKMFLSEYFEFKSFKYHSEVSQFQYFDHCFAFSFSKFHPHLLSKYDVWYYLLLKITIHFWKRINLNSIFISATYIWNFSLIYSEDSFYLPVTSHEKLTQITSIGYNLIGRRIMYDLNILEYYKRL